MSAVAKLAKPMLRGHLDRKIKMHLPIAFGLATAAATFWHFYVCEGRKENYRNFYATYDPDKDFERMKKAGVFRSCPPDEEE